jgi:hypothetical protein
MGSKGIFSQPMQTVRPCLNWSNRISVCNGTKSWSARGEGVYVPLDPSRLPFSSHAQTCMQALNKTRMHQDLARLCIRAQRSVDLASPRRVCGPLLVNVCVILLYTTVIVC